MPYDEPSTQSTGDLVTATIWNKIVNSILALRTGSIAIASQAALDFLYASSATQFARIAKGTAYQVPRINAAADGYEFADIALPVPCNVASTVFEASARFENIVVSGGTATYAASGLLMDTSATGGSSVKTSYAPRNGAGTVLLFPSVFCCSLLHSTIGTDVQAYFGLGSITVAGTGITFTVAHIGFKIVRASSGANQLFATVADGVTETASSALATIAATNTVDLAFRANSASSITFWHRINNGAWSSGTTLTTNIPASLDDIIRVGVSNVSVASQSVFQVANLFYGS